MLEIICTCECMLGYIVIVYCEILVHKQQHHTQLHILTFLINRLCRYGLCTYIYTCVINNVCSLSLSQVHKLHHLLIRSLLLIPHVLTYTGSLVTGAGVSLYHYNTYIFTTLVTAVQMLLLLKSIQSVSHHFKQLIQHSLTRGLCVH